MIPKDQIEKAKRAYLPGVLQAMGIELVSNGKGYHLREHDSLKLFQKDGIWLYKWWSREGEVGDGIEYLQRHYGMSFPEAVVTLSEAMIFQNSRPQHLSQQNPHCLEPKNKPQQWKTKKWQSHSEKLVRSLDNDQSGRNKTTTLISKLPNAIDWPVPEKYGNDPGEACKRMNLKQWVQAGLRNRPTLNR
jgi:hypothetical protein